MAIIVQLPDGRRVQFPDGMSREEMRTAMLKLPKQAETPDTPRSSFGRVLGLGARGAVEGVGDTLDMFSAPNPAFTLARSLRAFKPELTEKMLRPTRAGEIVADAIDLPSAETDGEKLGVAAVRGAASALPTLGAGAALRAAGAAPKLASFLTAAPAEQIASGAASGAASEAVRQNGGGTGAQIAAGLAAGILPGTLSFGGRAAGRTAAAGARAVEALSEGGQHRIAAENLRSLASHPEELVRKLENAEGEIVPGSRPTLGQVAEDSGLAVAEKGRANIGGKYLARYNQQKDAQLEEAGKILSSLERRSEARNAAFDKRSRAQAERFPQMDENVVEELDSLLPNGPSDAPESTYGMALRPIYEKQYQDFKSRVTDAYEAIDPEGATRFNLAPLRDAFAETMDQGRFAPQMPADVRNFMRELDEAVSNGQTASYRELQNIRSTLTDLAFSAQQKGEPNLHRIAQGMKRKLDEYLETAADYADEAVIPQPGSAAYRAAKQEASAIAKANVAADSPFWDSVWKHLDADSLARDFPDARRELADLHGRGLFARKGEGVPIDELADSLKIQGFLAPDADSSTLVELLKSKVRPKGRAAAELDTVLDGMAQYGAGFTPEQAQAFNRAKAMRREQGALFENDFNERMSRGLLRDDQIPGNYFKPGPAGDSAAKDFLRAFGDDPTARALMHGFIVEKFRKEALKNGVLDVKVMEKWLKNHNDALWNFPETKKQLENLVAAQKLVNQTKSEALANLEARRVANAGRDKLGAQIVSRGKDWKPRLGQRELTGDFEDMVRKSGLLSEGEILRTKSLQKAAEQMRRMDALSKVRGSPTAQNLATQSIMDTLLGQSLGRGKQGMAKAGWRGMLAGPVNWAIPKIYGSADARINELIDQAFLDPQFALELLKTYKPFTPEVSLGGVFKNQVKGAATSSARSLLDLLYEEEPKKKK